MAAVVEKVRIVVKVDENPDLPDLGKYSGKPGPCAIDREERGDMGRNEFRYWNPSNHCPPQDKDDERYIIEDYERMEAYARGDWHMVGVRAEAHVLAGPKGAQTRQVLRSAGLWGIESDSEKSYFQEVAEEQYAELADILKDFGVTRIPPFKDAEWKE